MNINLETILGIEFVGEEIDTFVSIMQKLHESTPTDDGKVGFKSNQPAPIEFTEAETSLASIIFENFKPVETDIIDDSSNRTDS